MRIGQCRVAVLVGALVVASAASARAAEEDVAPAGADAAATSGAAASTPRTALEPTDDAPSPALSGDAVRDEWLDDDAWLEEDLYGRSLDPEQTDPFERENRAVFWLNQKVERFVLDPISEVYQFVVPEQGRRAVHRAFLNLNASSIFVNDLLQLEPKRAGITGARFAINSTVGLAGLFDPARRIGLEPHHADFGQTLARAGVGSGPYLVLPVFGPSTARDAVGTVVDGLFAPQLYLLGPAGHVVLGAGSGLTTRDANLESLHALRETSIDFYAAMRSAYLMHRQREIEGETVTGASPWAIGRASAAGGGALEVPDAAPGEASGALGPASGAPR